MPTSLRATKKPPKKKKGREKTKKVARAIGQFTSALSSQNGELDIRFAKWSRYLLSRRYKPVEKLLHGAKEPLLWGLSPDQLDDRCVRQILALSSGDVQADSMNDLALNWLENAVDRPVSPTFALEAIAWVSALARLSKFFVPRLWSELFSQLVELAESEGVGQTLNGSPDDATGIWASQLLFGELAVTLAYHFPELPQCESLQSAGCRFVSESMLEILDGAGVLAAKHLHLTRKLLASWTRSVCIADGFQRPTMGTITAAASAQYSWMVRQTLRMTRSDASHPFLASQTSADKKRDVAMLEVAVEHIQDRQDHWLARLVLRNDEVMDRRLPDDPAYHSEWGGVAILQPEWSSRQPRLVIAYGDRSLRSELTNRGQVVFSGDVLPNVTINDAAVHLVSEWESTCWFSDHDVDFLEIEATLDNGWKMQRQHLLTRQDHFLWMADVLIGPTAADIQYRLDLPCHDKVIFQSAEQTTEGMLVGKKPLALVCAPSLPEWKTACRAGSIRSADSAWGVAHQIHGRAAYFPIFFDLHRRRMRQPVTWRQLTVAENLEIVPRDLAAGFRVHVGLEQWTFYRSLTKAGNRTMIGKNYASEFVCGRFLNDGDVEQLIEIETTGE